MKQVTLNKEKTLNAYYKLNNKIDNLNHSNKLLRLKKVKSTLDSINHLISFFSYGLNKYNINLVTLAIKKLYKKLELTFNTKVVNKLNAKLNTLKTLLLNLETLQGIKTILLHKGILIKNVSFNKGLISF